MLGGKTATSHDGTAAIPQAQRDAAHTVAVSLDLANELLALMHGENSGYGYPGGQQYNHIAPREMGPQKDDWTKACPPNESDDVRADKCLSLQEGVWGAEGLARLEAVKAAVDPNSLFMCYKCVGYTEAPDADAGCDESSEVPDADAGHDESSSAPTIAGWMLFAVAALATVWSAYN
ncbi:hypothetical protein ACHAWF_013811 [Thalassiosira exigua]